MKPSRSLSLESSSKPDLVDLLAISSRIGSDFYLATQFGEVVEPEVETKEFESILFLPLVSHEPIYLTVVFFHDYSSVVEGTGFLV